MGGAKRAAEAFRSDDLELLVAMDTWLDAHLADTTRAYPGIPEALPPPSPRARPLVAHRVVRGAPASIGPFLRDHYNWNADAPFEHGKVWVWTIGTNMHSYLYDLDRRAVVGELVRSGDPVLCRRCNSRLLVRGGP